MSRGSNQLIRPASLMSSLEGARTGFTSIAGEHLLQPISGAHGLFPSYQRILAETGWYAYVIEHVDIVQAYNFINLDHPSGPAGGVALLWNGLRIARVATAGRTDEQVCWVLCHEAGHLAGLDAIGEMYCEAIAEATANSFWADLSRLRGWR